MAGVENNTNKMLKRALQQRQTGSLPSNFSFRTMEKIHLEARKQQKHRMWTVVVSLAVAVLTLIGLAIYCLVFYMNFNFMSCMPDMSTLDDSFLFGFYSYIAFCVCILLGLDYWFRKKRAE